MAKTILKFPLYRAFERATPDFFFIFFFLPVKRTAGEEVNVSGGNVLGFNEVSVQSFQNNDTTSTEIPKMVSVLAGSCNQRAKYAALWGSVVFFFGIS